MFEDTKKALAGECPHCGHELHAERIEGTTEFLQEYSMIFPEGKVVPWADEVWSRTRGIVSLVCPHCGRRWQAVNRQGQSVDHLTVRFYDNRPAPHQHWVLRELNTVKGQVDERNG
jgi:predicted RNA-binding Zn-ribbon protein involved in translation (DUF1610 family)